MDTRSVCPSSVVLDAHFIMDELINFPQLFYAHTYASRLVGVVLFTAGLTLRQAVKYTGVTERTAGD